MPMNEEVANNYSEYKAKVDALEAENSTERVIFVFKGGNDDSGRSWCAICTLLDEAIENFKKKHNQIEGTIVKVNLGSLKEWKNSENPFRRDPHKIRAVPSMISWKSSKRLEGMKTLDSSKLEKFIIHHQEEQKQEKK